MTGHASEDPRVVDTRARIRSAVVELVTERGLHGTKIKDVLERAAVARATFYAHFEDKEDALVGGFDLFRIELPRESANGEPFPLPPLGGIFDHVQQMGAFFHSIKSRGELDVPLGIAQRDLLATYRDALAELDARGVALAGPIDELAQAATGAVLALMIAWLEGGAEGAARARATLAEDLVRRIVTG